MYPQTNKTILRRILIAAVVVVVLILASVGFLVKKSEEFHVVSTNPTVSSFATVSPFFNVYTNRELSGRGITVLSEPNIVASYSVRGKAIYIKIKPPLSSSRSYSITINGIADVGGKKLSPQIYTLSPQLVPSQDLPKDQRQALLRTQIQYNKKRSNPITTHLPYDTPNFNLGYGYVTVNGQQNLVLTAQLLIPQAFANNPQATESQDKQDINSYISSLGLNPANYTIQYSESQG